MYRSYFLIGITIGIIAGLLLPALPLQTKASTCTSSASAAGPNRERAFFATPSSAATARQVEPTRDQGCNSHGVAVANQGASCFAVNNGQAARINPNIQAIGSSCSASNQFGGSLESATR